MLRFIENDIKIKSFVINKTMIGIDTKKDYINFLKIINEDENSINCWFWSSWTKKIFTS